LREVAAGVVKKHLLRDLYQRAGTRYASKKGALRAFVRPASRTGWCDMAAKKKKKTEAAVVKDAAGNKVTMADLRALVAEKTGVAKPQVAWVVDYGRLDIVADSKELHLLGFKRSDALNQAHQAVSAGVLG